MTDTCKICGKGESAYATYHMPSCPKFDGYDKPITLTREEVEHIDNMIRFASRKISGEPTQMNNAPSWGQDIMNLLNSKLKE